MDIKPKSQPEKNTGTQNTLEQITHKSLMFRNKDNSVQICPTASVPDSWQQTGPAWRDHLRKMNSPSSCNVTRLVSERIFYRGLWPFNIYHLLNNPCNISMLHPRENPNELLQLMFKRKVYWRTKELGMSHSLSCQRDDVCRPQVTKPSFSMERNTWNKLQALLELKPWLSILIQHGRLCVCRQLPRTPCPCRSGCRLGAKKTQQLFIALFSPTAWPDVQALGSSPPIFKYYWYPISEQVKIIKKLPLL